jgi:hypothetical protein
MKSKIFYFHLFLLILLSGSTSIAQNYIQSAKHINPTDSVFLSNVPAVDVPEKYLGTQALLLEPALDNSELPYFRSIFSQLGWSCGQASSIGYNLTYELNRLRDLPANTNDNLYTPIHHFNFFNNGENGVGVCFLHTFDAIKHNGNPTITDYGGIGGNLQKWMNGYEKYYNGMHNRIDEVSSIYVGDSSGMQVLKNWLNDHLDGSAHGSLANFYTDLSGFEELPEGTPEEGKHVVIQFGNYSGHSLTVVGWNDSIRYDYNNDGQYTKNVDLNEDGILNMKDWEIGGLKFANSWGQSYADSGFCYVMYKVFAEEKSDGGIWNKSCFVIDVKEDYEPSLTYKLTVKHNVRNQLRFIAGVSNDSNSLYPQYTLDFPIFNYQGGPHYMQGNDTIEEHKIIEIGMDVTPLLSFVQNQQTAKFFFQIHENDPQNTGFGEIQSFSLIDYVQDGMEIVCNSSNIPINNNTYTILSLIHEPNFDKPGIENESLPAFIEGEAYSYQLAASGGTEPYNWDLTSNYNVHYDEANYPDIQELQLTPNNALSGFVTQQLDFPFPFYNQSYDSITLHVDGFLMFNEIKYPIPYQVNDLYLFKNEAMLAPFMNRSLRTFEAEDGIWYEGDENHAAFRWKLTLETEIENIPVDFSSILYPDGKIEYYFNIPEVPYPILNVTGVSAGDGISFEISDYSNLLQSKGQPFIKYSPQHFLSEVEIDETGLLNATPLEGDKIYNVNVRVTDDNEISGFKTFQLSNGLTYTYTILSGDDDQIDYGETAYLSFEVRNMGSNTIENTQLQLAIEDDHIEILDGQENIGSILPGQTINLEEAVSFEVSADIPNNYNLSFTTDFTSDSGNWSSFINISVYSPLIRILEPIILDEDGQLDPGETVEIIFPVFNFGQSPCLAVEGAIEIEDDLISFSGSNLLNYGNIDAGKTVNDTIAITIAELTPIGHITEIIVNVNAEPELNFSKSFNYMIGKIPVLVIDLDPDQLSAPVIQSTLQQLSVIHQYIEEVPENLNQYYNVFLSLGRNFSSYILTEQEGILLAEYLMQGGNLYMEGGLTWTDVPQTPVHPLFNLSTETFTWNIFNDIIGIEGTFTEDMLFEYEGDMQYYNFSLLPNDSSFSVFYGNAEHNYAIAFAGSLYRTIGTTFDFGGLVDDYLPSTRKYYLAKVLEFFGMDGVISAMEENSIKKTDNTLNISPNPVRENTTIKFYLKNEDLVSLIIYDTFGNIITNLVDNKNLLQGEHSINLSVEDMQPGIYFCCLKTSNYELTKKIIKAN